jgi:hypothetical protein
MLEDLMAEWTSVSVEEIAKLHATVGTFSRKHNSMKASEVPLLA